MAGGEWPQDPKQNGVVYLYSANQKDALGTLGPDTGYPLLEQLYRGRPNHCLLLYDRMVLGMNEFEKARTSVSG